MTFNEELHPRVPAGKAGGGEFGQKSSGSKTAEKGHTAKPAEKGSSSHHNPGPLKKTLAYDPKSNHGPGYGEKNGDPHVHQLQEALNRLGATDAHGKKLVDDGKLGPLTTQSIKMAQRRLGLKADGQVTPAFLEKLLATKAFPTAKRAAPGPDAMPEQPRQMSDAECEAALQELLAGLTDEQLRRLGDMAAAMHAEDAAARSRFSELSAELATHGAHDPDALAAYIGRKKYGHEAFQHLAAAGRAAHHHARSEVPLTYRRTFELEGIEILSRAKGYPDGRTVEAYAAVFDVPKEIRDQHGHYIESNDPTSFNRTINGGAARRSLVLYNHGFDARGKSGGLPSVPIGHPVEIRADRRGLLTISRYNESEFADTVLESIKNGDITAQSYEGPIYRSDPMKVPTVRRGQPLPKVRRLELGLRNYGPTPTPYFPEAEITAVRSAAMLAEEVARLDREQRDELIRALATTPGWDPELAAVLATPHRGPGAEDSRGAHSDRLKRLRLRAEAMLSGV